MALSSIYAFPDAAGVKLRGANIAPKYSDWYSMLYKWGTAHADNVWASWIEPQLDAAESIGINAIRLICVHDVRIAGRPGGTLSQAQWFALLDQFYAGCAARGMWVYPAVTASQYIANGITNAYISSYTDVLPYITEFVAYTSAKSNTLGYDVVQEFDQRPVAEDHLSAYLSTASAALTRDLPLTCSFTMQSGSDLPGGGAYKGDAVLSAGADFLDPHIYTSTADADVQLFLAEAPTFIGEVGIQTDGSLLGGGSGSVATIYASIGRWGNFAGLQGLCQWDLIDWDGQLWGIFDNDISTPRTPQTTEMQTIPVVAQPYDAGDDVGPMISSAPTTTGRTSTTVSLSWSAASGGTGLSYTPQCAPSDADGFPTDAWVSGDPTGGTTAIISGATSAPHVTRVLVSRASGGYAGEDRSSPWGQADAVPSLAWRSI